MPTGVREYVHDFALSNPLYAGARVTFFRLNPVTLLRTTTLAVLYADLVSTVQLGNPVTLDAEGKWQYPVYLEEPSIMLVTGAVDAAANVQTGIVGPIGSYKGDWAAATNYYTGDTVRDGAASSNTSGIYYCAGSHLSGVFATDLAADLWLVYVDAAAMTAGVVANTLASATASAAAAAASQASATASASSSTASAVAAGASATTATAQAAAAAASAAAADASADSAALFGGRNIVDNGNFNTWQRGTPTASLVGPIDGVAADRWRYIWDGVGGSTVMSRFRNTDQTLLDLGISHAISIAIASQPAGGTFRQLAHDVEGAGRLSGRDCVMSFYAWCGAGTLACNTFQGQFFGTGGSPSATVNTPAVGFTLTTTVQRFIIPLAVPTVAGKTFGTNFDDRIIVVLNLPLVATGTLFFAGLQIEEGTVPTRFEIVPVQWNLARCQRFYFIGNVKMSGAGSLGGVERQTLTIPTLRTATPIVTPAFTTETNCGTSDVNVLDRSTLEVLTTVTAAGHYDLIGAYAVNAEY